MQADKKNNQKKGIEHLLGKDKDVFQKEGCIWWWSFTWNDTKKPAHGYDRGQLPASKLDIMNQNGEQLPFEDLLARLKKRLFHSILKEALPKAKSQVVAERMMKYHEVANYFRVMMYDMHSKEDTHIFSIRFDCEIVENKKVYKPIFHFSDYTKDAYPAEALEDFKKVFNDYTLFVGNFAPPREGTPKIAQRIIFNKTTPNTTVNEPKQEQMQVAKPAQVLTLQERYNDAVHTVFGEDKTKLRFLKFNVATENKNLIILNAEVAHITSNGELAQFEDEFLSVLEKIVKKMDLSGLEYRFTKPVEVHKTTPNGIPVGDTVQEILNLVQIPINNKIDAGIAVNAFGKGVTNVTKQTKPVHSEERQAHLDYFNMLKRQERTEEARNYWLEHPHIFNPQP